MTLSKGKALSAPGSTWIYHEGRFYDSVHLESILCTRFTGSDLLLV